MVSYMWGKDVADALLAADAASEDFEVCASAADIYKSIELGINRLYEIAVGLAADAASEDCEAVMDAYGRVWPLRMPIEFRPIDKPQSSR